MTSVKEKPEGDVISAGEAIIAALNTMPHNETRKEAVKGLTFLLWAMDRWPDLVEECGPHSPMPDDVWEMSSEMAKTRSGMEAIHRNGNNATRSMILARAQEEGLFQVAQ